MILKGSSRGFQVWPPQKVVPRKVLERMIKIKKLFIWRYQMRKIRRIYG